MKKLFRQKQAHFLAAQMAVLISSFLVFVVFGIYNFAAPTATVAVFS